MKAAEARPGDSDLVARLRTGDPDALRAVVERYQDRIFALIYGIVRDRHEVEDVAQEVFLKVFRRIDAFDGRSRFYTWLYRVAANTAKDHVKKRSRRPSVALEEEERIESDTHGPSEQASRTETRRRVRAAIDGLAPRYREVLTLRELEGLSYNEIAAVLRVSIGTVESRLHRARQRLKEVLSNDA
ncbi:MAG: sigma-70 family RNA polymerase sigma factor [Planctomycetota bacterium]